MLAGEKEKMPEELLQLEGRLVEEAMVGLDGTTGRDNGKQRLAAVLAPQGKVAQTALQHEPSPNAQGLACCHHLVQVRGMCDLQLVVAFLVFIMGLLSARSMLGTGVPQVRGQSALTRVRAAQSSNRSEPGQLCRSSKGKPEKASRRKCQGRHSWWSLT